MAKISVLKKSFGGLSKEYYFRQIFFALCFYIPFMLVIWLHNVKVVPHSEKAAVLITILYGVNTLLYPYSRFVYESIVGFIIGSNAFLVNSFFYLIAKLMTMMLCWGLAIFIAPFGLIYLYLRNH